MYIIFLRNFKTFFIFFFYLIIIYILNKYNREKKERDKKIFSDFNKSIPEEVKRNNFGNKKEEKHAYSSCIHSP